MKNGRARKNILSGRNGAKNKNGGGGKIAAKIRVTGGILRGREFLSPRSAGTHPMGTREKIALFNMLTGEITGARVLDAYAGSGALGIEALSRGAREVVFVEKNTGVARVLKENLRLLGLKNTEVRVMGMREFVEESEEGSGEGSEEGSGEGEEGNEDGSEKGNEESDEGSAKRTEKKMGQDGDKSIEKDMERDVEQKFDIILADPPYDKFDITEVDLLTKLLKHGGIMALSHPEVKSEATEVAPTLTGAELIKSKKYAGARISIYQCL